MLVGLAWTILGFDAEAVILKLVKTPRIQRVQAAREELEHARKAAKHLMALHHPDRGGDPEKFRRVTEAIRAIEEQTESFATKMASIDADKERASKKPFIKLGS